MNIQLILLPSICCSMIAMGIHIWISPQRLNILNARVDLLKEHVVANEDTMYGMRHVVLSVLDGSIEHTKKEIEDLKCTHEKCLKHGGSSSGNGHTA